MRVTVLGIGQSMRGDDGAGIAAVRRWEESFPHTARRSDVSVQYSELPGLALLDLLEGFDASVLVDAVEAGTVPGTIYRLGIDDLAAFSGASQSAHGWGVAETLALARRMRVPERLPTIRLVGIAAGQMQLGAPLSEVVAQALPAACAAIEDEVQTLLAPPSRLIAGPPA